MTQDHTNGNDTSGTVRWSSEDTFIWYVRGGKLDGTYYRQHFPNLVDGYDGEVVLWHWDSDGDARSQDTDTER